MSRTEIPSSVRRQVLCEFGGNPYRSIQDPKSSLLISFLIKCLMCITVFFSDRTLDRVQKTIASTDNRSRNLRTCKFGAIWTTALYFISVGLLLQDGHAITATIYCGNIDDSLLIVVLAIFWGGLAIVPMVLCLQISSRLRGDYFRMRKVIRDTQWILPTRAEKHSREHHGDLADTGKRTLGIIHGDGPPPSYHEDKTSVPGHVPDGSSLWQETNGISMPPSAVTRIPSPGNHSVHSAPRRTGVSTIPSNPSQDVL